ncbi:MAG TPA: hypothetical protein VEX11_09360, partial [Acetobacteraceae bacterium]|nr:hypothetical protein [Acetobacteraceae bacterium]
EETADRAAEERSEEGMAEHRAKAGNPARWAAERRARTGHHAPGAERGSGRTGVFGSAMVSCAALAALALARSAFRRVGAGARAAASPGRPAR